ncbi:MAG: NAD(P)H-dependent glycerol-3-phosphate dehydrogenase [Clostridia bacterium]|nr:NAD(P)H-dependent glycerol-3-phosphate dehydrogenase [Clostridia bacterium]
MSEKIAVIGSGSWGTAAAVHLCNQGHDVTLWSWLSDESNRLASELENKEFLPGIALPSSIHFTADISCVKDKNLIVLVTPSKAIRATCHSMAPHVTDGTLIVILSKGIEDGTLCTLSEIVEDEIPNCRVAVMSGPSHAEEVALGIPTTNIAACNDVKYAEYIQSVFMSDNFRVYTGTDVLGVELGGALKNIIALCAGITDGIGFGDNTKAALMTRGIKEISRLGISMGAEADTFWGLSGIGDLIVTCTSMHSRNRRAGILIGEGKSLDEALSSVHMVVEGVQSCRAAYELARKYGVEMPIVQKAYEVLYEGKNPKDAVVELMQRNPKSEN